MLESLSDWLIGFGLYNFVNAHDWVWPVAEMIHFMGMAMLIGSVGLLDLRILGLGKGIPIGKLEALVPIGVIGFVLNAITGTIFVVGNPTGGPIVYLSNLAFQIKVVLMVLAAINLAVFYMTGISNRTDAVGPTDEAALNAKLIAGASLFFWISVIVFGRLIMYNDTLLLFLGL